jgi:diaminopimelate decarboxylase
METPFLYKGDLLFCEQVPLVEIAREFGTPCYVYSYARIIQNYHAFVAAFSRVPHFIAYAVKANSNGAILRALAHRGSGADVVSGGELERALAAGIPPDRIVFAGVGKQMQELERAIASRILCIHVESIEELCVLGAMVTSRSRAVPIAIRVNPDVKVHTHPYVSTGKREDKFGIPAPQTLSAYRRARGFGGLEVVGIHMHIGSQITELTPYREALQVVLSLAADLAAEGINLRLLDIGGGLGISYAGEPVPTPSDLARVVLPLLENFEGTLVLEPGRAIVADAGVLLTEVLYRKPGFPRPFLIVDAGMNDLIRPCLYHALHRVAPVHRCEGEMVMDIVGPICESADVLAQACSLPPVERGDTLAIRDVGAYGFSMASRYNSRPCAAEVMVREKEAFLIRERETVKDLTARERMPRFLQ